MALIVGIENKEKSEMFNKKELEFLSSFDMGVVAMFTGVGRIKKDDADRYGVTVDVAVDRFRLMLHALNVSEDAWFINGKQDKRYKQHPLTKRDFVQKMADAEWSCNVGIESDEQFIHKLKNHLLNNAWDEIKPKHMSKPYWNQWNKVVEQRDAVKGIIGQILSGDDSRYYDNNDWIVESLTDSFEFWGEKVYGKILRYNDDTGKAFLSDKTEAEEEALLYEGQS